MESVADLQPTSDELRVITRLMVAGKTRAEAERAVLGRRMCVMCKHLEVEHAWEQDSDSGTSWNGGGFSCKKQHFSERNFYSTEDFRECIFTSRDLQGL